MKVIMADAPANNARDSSTDDSGDENYEDASSNAKGSSTDDSDDENYEDASHLSKSDGETDSKLDAEEVDPDLPDPETVDRLWNEFISPPVKEKEEAKLRKDEVKKVKQYEFAGEKVALSSPDTDTAKPGSSISSYKPADRDLGDNCETLARFGGQSVIAAPTNEDGYENRNVISVNIDTEGDPVPPPIRRGGLSYLSGKADQIGLTGHKGRAGLSNFLACLKNSKRQKLGTLEKSRMDWEAFKRDAGIVEELQNQIKGKQGFLERQEFLQRSDLRTFEIEKNVREKKRRLN